LEEFGVVRYYLRNFCISNQKSAALWQFIRDGIVRRKDGAFYGTVHRGRRIKMGLVVLHISAGARNDIHRDDEAYLVSVSICRLD